MDISPRELRDTEIAEAFRGYNRDVVNEMLERAAATIEAAEVRVRQAAEQLNSAQAEAGRTRETEDILHRTLLLAQRAADEAVNEAQEKARQLLADAEATAATMLADAESDARQRGELERTRLEAEIIDYAARRDALSSDVEAMSRFEGEYRDRMVRALEADLVALRTRPSAAPGAQPTITPVEIPKAEAAAPPAARRESQPQPLAEPASEPTASVDVRAILDQQLAPAASSPPAPAPPTSIEEPRTAPPVPAMAVPDPSSAEPVSSEEPAIDLDDAVDAEVLDDDAFFATFREAVHDDSPLGPRDDAMSFFDEEEDADRGSFFRRRR